MSDKPILNEPLPVCPIPGCGAEMVIEHASSLIFDVRCHGHESGFSHEFQFTYQAEYRALCALVAAGREQIDLHKLYGDRIANLEAEIARLKAEPVPSTCFWHYTEGSDSWESRCGVNSRGKDSIDGDRYCSECGGRIATNLDETQEAP